MPFRQIEIPALGRRLSNVMVQPSSAQADVEGLEEYRRLGGNCLYLHGEGGETESRRQTGLWLTRQKREELFLCSAICHNDWDEQAKRAIERFTPEALREDVAVDLELLRTNYLDLIFLDDRPNVPFEPMMEAIHREIARGRMRAWGVSNWSPARLRAANEFAARAGGRGAAVVVTTELALVRATQPLWPEYLALDAEMKEAIRTLGLAVFAHALDLNLGQCLFGDADALARPEWVRRWEHPENRGVVKRVEMLAKRTGYTTREINVAWVLNQAIPTIGIVNLPGLLAHAKEYERAAELCFGVSERTALSSCIH